MDRHSFVSLFTPFVLSHELLLHLAIAKGKPTCSYLWKRDKASLEGLICIGYSIAENQFDAVITAVELNMMNTDLMNSINLSVIPYYLIVHNYFIVHLIVRNEVRLKFGWSRFI